MPRSVPTPKRSIGAPRRDQVRDLHLLEVAADRDRRVLDAGVVEQPARQPGELLEVAGVDPHPAQRAAGGAGGGDRVADALLDVVGVDEQDAVLGEAAQVGLEGLPLARRRRGRRSAPSCPSAAGRSASRRRRSRCRRSRRSRRCGRPSSPRRCRGRGGARSRSRGRRAPGSPPPAASATRAALVAIMVWKLTWLSSRVSTSWPSIRGAVTRSSGSLAKARVPSGIASTSPVKRRVDRRSRKASSKPRERR